MTVDQLETLLAEVSLPRGVHAAVLSDSAGPTDVWCPRIVVWANRSHSRCPGCGQPVAQDLSQDVPVSLNRGELQPYSQQHPCGEWLSILWSEVSGTGEVTVVDVERAAHQLAAEVDNEHVRLRAAVEAQLRQDLKQALQRLAEPLAHQETREDREDEVRTGSDVEPGVYRGEQWLAWAFDPTGISSEPITVTERNLATARS
ncbi:hypothetical protein ABZ502_17560 [Streptomyces abikoensis]|uniref:hypothetical protein n=1 Tax=Streptomyces abikoensis TaxID=97398 RepID=UPI0033FC00B2